MLDTTRFVGALIRTACSTSGVKDSTVDHPAIFLSGNCPSTSSGSGARCYLFLGLAWRY